MSEAQAFEVVTLFPELVRSFASQGLMKKAVETGRIEIYATDPRDFVEAGYRSVDDTPFGGGPGMVMQAEPVARAIESIEQARGPSVRVLVTPSAPRFDQGAARTLAQASRVTILCGRYEGIDDRVREHMVDHCFSLGDFVLNGGEVAALAVIEAVARLRQGVLGNAESVALESFAEHQDGGTTLEHPQYTKPANWRGHVVPMVLQSGDHQRISRWRRHCALARTWGLRPDLRPARTLDEMGPRPRLALAVVAAKAEAGQSRKKPAPEFLRLVEGVSEAFDAGAWWVGPRAAAPAHFLGARSLGDLRRTLRKRGAAPKLVRLWASDLPAPPDALNAPALLDALGCEDPREEGHPTWILLVAFGASRNPPGYEATLVPALNTQAADLAQPRPQREDVLEKDRHEVHIALANTGALIDISQPAAPHEGLLAATVQTVTQALDGLFGPPA